MKGRSFLAIVLAMAITVLAKMTEARTLNSSIGTHQSKINSTSHLQFDKIKGVSVGGWLVTEPFISPSLFWSAIHWSQGSARSNVSIVDEYTLCQVLGQERARVLLLQHYKTWITRNDIQEIKRHGFNLVRIPIGYWAWKKQGTVDQYVNNITFYDPYVGGLQLDYFENALRWCKEAGLKAWIDLHTAPGSQNGFDNSGQRLLNEDLGWLAKNTTKELTHAILRNIFDEYVDGKWKDVIVGVEIINEPMGHILGIENVIEFYNETINDYLDTGKKTPLVIQEAFQDVGFWNDYWNDTKLTIYVDHHHYEVFSYDQLLNDQFTRLTNIMEYGEALEKEQSAHGSIVGEWSGAITDCATWLNGLGIGARYDGTYYKTVNSSREHRYILGACQSHKDISLWDREYKMQVRQFIEAQLTSFSANSKGWIFWNWKTESAPEWDYLKLVTHGVFPHPFDNLTYFNSDGSMGTVLTSSLESSRNNRIKYNAHASSSAALGPTGIAFNAIKLLMQTASKFVTVLLFVVTALVAF
ncbi:glucan exo-1,3-beta-glucosidase Ecym_5578 [Eremothecium cymbalariae DBVPG|uniref:Glycoside hydrolase family 5 domain-containing protein n=1 Tax=Eremothecium cymbalariae (strain CBS 270.75 / DBVPG 7215 / KCTC 17166 / NRRL Y-17582) TaxID=931890 RepID=I6NE24_ERECY|nr:hypothetical protein Ecym_5578 [Eremothecium cymbalariae DBVPG\